MKPRCVATAAAIVSLLPGSASLSVLFIGRRGGKIGLRNAPKFTLVLAGMGLWLLPTGLKALPSASYNRIFIETGTATIVIAALIGTWAIGQRVKNDNGLSGIALGAVFGSTTMAALSLLEALLTPNERSNGWLVHPNTWAAQALLPGLAPFVVHVSWRLRIWSSLATLVVTFTSGSRTILIGFLIAALILTVWSLHEQFHRAEITIVGTGLLLTAVVMMITLSPRISTTLRDLTSPLAISTSKGNLLSGVGQLKRVRLISATPPSAARANPTIIAKTDDSNWGRLQHSVLLFPNTEYVISLELYWEDPAILPGLLGIGHAGENSEAVQLRIWSENDQWVTSSVGAIEVLEVQSSFTGDGWIRLETALRYEGQQAVRWWVGPTPDQREVASQAILYVRKFQLELGTTPSPFTAPSPSHLSTIQALSRLFAFKVAWQGFLEKPWVGQPVGSFALYYRANPPSQDTAIPGHAHNLFLQTLFERGFIGLIGLLLFLIGILLIGLPASKKLLVVFATVIAINLTDFTLWAGVAYSFAALTGYLRGFWDSRLHG